MQAVTSQLPLDLEPRSPAQPRVGKHHRDASPTELAAAKKQVPVIGEKTKTILEELVRAGYHGLIRWEIAAVTGYLLSSVCSCLDALEKGGWVEKTERTRVAVQTGSPGAVYVASQRGRNWVNRARRPESSS